MTFLKDITKKVTETAKVAAKKSSDLVEVTKLNMNISSEEEKIQKVYAQIGKIVFEAYEKGDQVEEAFKELCESVVSYKDNIKTMKQQILKLRNIKLCPECNAELESEVAYCPKCGTKQEIITTAAQEVNNEEKMAETEEKNEEIVSEEEKES
ncbi:MAG: zinc ribbon domain-containing protein, partial [Bacillota bacterium]